MRFPIFLFCSLFVYAATAADPPILNDKPEDWDQFEFHFEKGVSSLESFDAGRLSSWTSDAGLAHFQAALEWIVGSNSTEALQVSITVIGHIGHAHLKLGAFETAISSYETALQLAETHLGHDHETAILCYQWLSQGLKADKKMVQAHQAALTAAQMENSQYGAVGPLQARYKWENGMLSYLTEAMSLQIWNHVQEAAALELEADELWDRGELLAARTLYETAAKKERAHNGVRYNHRLLWLWRKASLVVNSFGEDHRRVVQRLQPVADCHQCSPHYLERVQAALQYHLDGDIENAILGYRAALEEFDIDMQRRADQAVRRRIALVCILLGVVASLLFSWRQVHIRLALSWRLARIRFLLAMNFIKRQTQKLARISRTKVCASQENTRRWLGATQQSCLALLQTTLAVFANFTARGALFVNKIRHRAKLCLGLSFPVCLFEGMQHLKVWLLHAAHALDEFPKSQTMNPTIPAKTPTIPGSSALFVVHSTAPGKADEKDMGSIAPTIVTPEKRKVVDAKQKKTFSPPPNLVSDCDMAASLQSIGHVFAVRETAAVLEDSKDADEDDFVLATGRTDVISGSDHSDLVPIEG